MPNNADLWKKFRRVCRLLASGAGFVSVGQTFVLGGQATQWRCASRGSLPRAVQPMPAAPVDARACWSFAEWVTASAMALLAGKPSLPLSVGWPRRDSAEGGTCVIFGGGYPLGWRTPRDPR